jgi:hypothetical protein
MNTVEYVKHWAKLHDANLRTDTDSFDDIYVLFKDEVILIRRWEAEQDSINTKLYDLVYGVRESVPETVRF